MTRKWYATLRHPKMYPHTKFGIPTSKNIGDMDRTRKRDGRTDGRTDGLTDGRTVRLLYASQSSFGGIKMYQFKFKVCSHKRTTYWPCIYHIQPNKQNASFYFFLGGGGGVLLCCCFLFVFNFFQNKSMQAKFKMLE